jgi:hypothetical protein
MSTSLQVVLPLLLQCICLQGVLHVIHMSEVRQYVVQSEARTPAAIPYSCCRGCCCHPCCCHTLTAAVHLLLLLLLLWPCFRCRKFDPVITTIVTAGQNSRHHGQGHSSNSSSRCTAAGVQ